MGVHHGVTFNFGFGKVCSPAIFETCFSYDKDIWIAEADYCIYFYIIVLFPLTAFIQLINCLVFIFTYIFIALIHPIQWTIAYPVGADRPAKRQKKMSCVATGRPVPSTVHSPDGASYFLPV